MNRVASCRLPYTGCDRCGRHGAGQPGCTAARRARTELGRRFVFHQPPPLFRVLPREQVRQRHVGESRIAVPGLAVGEGELRALRHCVHVLGARMAERRELEALEQAQLLQEDGRLAPRTCLQHCQPGVVDGEGRLVGRPPVAQIPFGQ